MIRIIRIIKIIKIIIMIKKIKIIKLIEIIKVIKIVKQIMSCMSFLFRSQWSSDKILPILVYIFIVVFPVWAWINNSVSVFKTNE